MELVVLLPTVLQIVTLICVANCLLMGGPKDVALQITRQNNGDIFSPEDASRRECQPETCVGLSSGTAASLPGNNDLCTCQCHPHLPAFREDLRICVDDIHECVLAPFVGGSTSQQIPFVFLPLKGQIIHPSKEISFAGIQSSVCVISGAKFLTEAGWVDLRNPLDTDVPFRVFRLDGRSFLQWVGEPELRTKMSGRLVLVYLKCREAASTPEFLTPTGHTIFSPCVAFRIVGSPTKYLNNVSEVAFSADQSSAPSERLSVSEYIAIGICSVLLGLIYVASVFLYLHLRRRSRENVKKLAVDEENLKHNLQNEDGANIIKNNPLLSLAHFQAPDSNIYSDSTNSDMELPPDLLQSHHDNNLHNKKTTSALIHNRHNNYDNNLLSSDSNNIEKLPEENVSIVETLETKDDRLENFKAITGTVRRKLYFNPAYFEPQLLLAPPPAALEFLAKIREVITIAKQKMAAKKFAPSLMGIPEEENQYGVERGEQIYDYGGRVSRRSSVISLKRQNSRRRTCSGCPGCEPQDFNQLTSRLPEFRNLAACDSCSVANSNNSDKQKIIRKWLEDVPVLQSVNVNNNESVKNDDSGKKLRLRAPRSLPCDDIQRSLSPKATSENGRRRLFKNVKAPQPPINDNHDNKNNINMALPPPDMINEALVIDNSNDIIKVPTLTKRNMKKVIDELNDRNSPTDESIKKIDYETDSLERSQQNQAGYHTPSEYAELSSQPSPSLSAALPMDEELTMRNAIFNKNTGNMTISKINVDILQDGDDDDHDYELIVLKKGSLKYKLPELLQANNAYNLVSEVYVNNGYNYSSAPSSPSDSNCSTLDKRALKVTYDDCQNPGKLLIEVKDCLDHYIPIDESDNFEPDTLDRKPIKKEQNNNNKDDYSDSLERPNTNNNNKILLKSSGSFKKQPFNRTFGSLREIYEAKQALQIEEGRLLTLEKRHCKRQRNLIPPDVIPPPPHDSSPIYERPKAPRRVDDVKPPLPPKNAIGRSVNANNNNNVGTPVSYVTNHNPDSGYLSTDKGSESGDESLRSESGAESVETHSVFFGSLRKNNNVNNNNNKGSYLAFGSIDSGVEVAQ